MTKVEGKKKENSLTLSSCSKEQFIAAISSDKADNFAKTFVAKADMQKQWRYCIGCFDGEELLGAIITTISKRPPYVANLQLLHTFAAHRGKGVAKLLCQDSLRRVLTVASYYRVSSEVDAVDFYKKIGFKFWGEQKSGCQLSMFKINGSSIFDGVYNYNDRVIRSAIHKKGKGGCYALFDITKETPACFLSEFLV